MEPGTLYVVSTPVGNIADITLRALEVLKQVDVIAAEDTRHTGLLLKRHGISANQLVSYHEHNESRSAGKLVALLEGGADVALVSDAGTPAISDPGYRVIVAAGERGIPVVPIPGPSALLAALVASGLPTDRFLFEGFLPRKKGRTARLKELATFDGTVIIYESPLRLQATLRDVLTHFGDRRVAFCRELTKKFETVVRGSAAKVLKAVEQSTIKGECVLVVGKEGLS